VPSPLPPALIDTDGCNGIFSGNIRRSIRVHDGQKCKLVNATVRGKIEVRGGSVELLGTFVQGSIRAEYASVLIGKDSSVRGDVYITTRSRDTRLCGADFGGDVTIGGEGASSSVQIGSPIAYICSGNQITGDLRVEGIDGSVVVLANTIGRNAKFEGNHQAEIYSNAIGGEIECRGNRSLLQAFNQARKSKGQCLLK